MNRYVERGWRPLFGALAIGLAAFGLSLQGAPAGDGTDLLVASGTESVDAAASYGSKSAVPADNAESQEQRKMAPIPGQSEGSTDPTAVEPLDGNAVMIMARVISGVPVSTKGGAASSRAAGEIPIGEACSCDEDCVDVGDDCNLVQCIVRGICEDGTTPCTLDGDCTGDETCDIAAGVSIQRCALVQVIGGQCDVDADFCTLDRCEDDDSGTETSVCVGQNTKSDLTGGSLSVCAKQCVGGPAAGLNCTRSGDCAQGACELITGMGCDSGAEACFVGASLATALGRCCVADACTETDKTDCEDNLSGVWYRYRSKNEQVGDGNCLCPKYGSGVAPPGSFNGSSADFGLVRPSGLICQTGSDVTDTEVYCETAGTDTKFCQDRCIGGDAAGAVCVNDNPDCAQTGTCSVGGTICVVANEASDCGICSESGGGCDGTAIQPCPGGATDICEFDVVQICNPLLPGTCGPDVCGPNTTEGSCEDGFLNIGDDYSVQNASFLRLTQFRFRGGITNLGETFTIEFWNTAGTRLIGGFGVGLPRAGENDWALEIDCWPNCDPTQNEVQSQVPLILPPTGYVVMRATRTTGTIAGSASFWTQTLNPADVGLNDDGIAWVSGDPNGSLGTNVFIFELVGTKVPDPLGACCDDDESCEDTVRWDCGICTVTEPPVLCSSTLHDCPDRLSDNSICQFNLWAGPVSHDDFETGNPNLTLCNGISPCDSGACCDGTSCSVQTPTDCANAGGLHLGILTTCNPNCCPVENPTGSDCICSTSTCVEIALTCLGGADEGEDCVTSADCALTDPADTGECGNFNTGRICTSDADCSAVSGTCILQCEPNGVTQLRHPFECNDDVGSPLEPRQDCDPKLPNALSCPPIPCTQNSDCPAGIFCDLGFCEDTLAMTCEKSIGGVFSVVRNDTITGELFTAVLGDQCSINTTADRTGWYEQINLPDDTPGDGSDDCYILTVGLCCTDPALTPIWPFLSSYLNCPCVVTADVIGTAPDFDIAGNQLDGFGAASRASLRGRCADSNYSATFTVPPGDYAYQINADTACSGSIIGCDDDDDCPGSSCNVPNPDYSVLFTVESCQIAACCVDSTCILTNELDCRAQDGTFLGTGDNPVATCQVDACEVGSCCLDGVCNDTDLGTQGACEVQDGIYLGGTVCLDDPCPACAYDFPQNCQQVQTIFGTVPLIDRNPDRNATSTEGTVAADDVKFGGSVVDNICWNAGHYAEPCCADCSDVDPPINDSWEIRIFETDPDCNGLPAGQVPGGFSTITVLNRVQGTGQASNTWQYSGALDTAIVLPNGGLAGDTYWFEVSAFGINECGVHANWSRDHGNEHYVSSQVDPDSPNTRDYNLSGVNNADLGFCEDSGILNPGVVLGSCCTCFATCQENFTQTQCIAIDGVWLACASCAESPCPGAPDNDLCGSPFLVSNVPEHDEGDPFTPLSILGENICADTDGPGLTTDVSDNCAASLQSGAADMFNDVWYKYTATACGDLTVESCGAADMDQMLAIYDATNDCPLTDAEQIACEDDSCGIGAGPSTITQRVIEGREYLIRMGGWRRLDGQLGDARGSFDLNWDLLTGVCAGVEPLPRADAPHAELKNRYISVNTRGETGINPTSLHISVSVDSTLVVGLDFDDGARAPIVWWAEEPDADCISYVTRTKPAVEPDWSACPTAHLTGCPIVTTTTYAIVAESAGESSPPSLLDTQAKPGIKWMGDVVGAFSGTEWSGPNGQTNIDDAVAAIKTFQKPANLPGCGDPPCNATHKSTTDVAPNLTPDGPFSPNNRIVNIEDVLIIIIGFGGAEYPGIVLTRCE